jgi:hypothetical protein
MPMANCGSVLGGWGSGEARRVSPHPLGALLPSFVSPILSRVAARSTRSSPSQIKATTLRFASVSPWMYRCVLPCRLVSRCLVRV